ncbi:hypothetical protein MTR_3g116780 [Medicago truncatula]|uniref:Uncharacterized protein n=1 Tax=Medicago truncatula TaxID=3880 RepID=G7J738_MEDTR|nr:hypothetical protein MTR_3g116780 [Medicago truncatula]
MSAHNTPLHRILRAMYSSFCGTKEGQGAGEAGVSLRGCKQLKRAGPPSRMEPSLRILRDGPEGR